MKYSDKQRIDKIAELTEKLITYVEEEKLTVDKINANEPTRWAITTPLYNIGEHTYYLSDEYKDKYPDIPWSKISGLRHRLVHDYEDTNWEIVSSIIFDVLPVFKNQIDKVKNEE